MRGRWTREQAWAWYTENDWIMGVNYVPSVTLHAAELWQEDTHAEVMQSVKRELRLMQKIGINGVRMFMPFSVWYHDREKFLDRLDGFLGERAARGITMMPVLFNDSVPRLAFVRDRPSRRQRRRQSFHRRNGAPRAHLLGRRALAARHGGISVRPDRTVSLRPADLLLGSVE